MATVTALGTGSGLQLETLVSKLMTAESVPLTTLQRKQASYNTKISAMGTLRSALTALQTTATAMMPDILQSATDKFSTYTSTVANTSIASATASTGAVAGSYSLEVGTLAQAQRLTSSAFSSSSTSLTRTGGTLTLELGTLSGFTFTADSSRTYSISLDAGSTLANLRDKINAANAGVTATIINGTAGAQLVLTGAEGTNNVMRLSSSDVSGLNYDPSASGSQGWTQTSAAQDAAFTLNGIAATSHSNTVTNALDGITLQLSATTTPGSPTTVTVTQDVATNLTKALQSFQTAYNSALSTMSTLGAYNVDTKVAGDLQGNGTLRYAQSQITQMLLSTTSGSTTSNYKTLLNVGVSIDANGKLAIVSTKLNAALKADPNTVATLIGNVGSAFNTAIDNLTGITGPITVATNGLTATVKDFTARQAKLQDRLDAIEARYRSQFSALDTLVSGLNSTGDYLTSVISSLNQSGA